MTAVLLGRTFRLAEAWGVMLGMSMLAIGTASRLGLASVASMFVMGIAISALSPHRADITAMIAPTERPVMLPALLLAGAGVDFTTARWLPWVLAAAVAARLAAKQVVGLAVLAAAPAARRAGARLGLGLSSTGALSMSIGLTFALRFRGPVGDAVLAAAAVATVAGELIGPASLRACLRRAGEVPPRPATDTSIPSAARGPRRAPGGGAALVSAAVTSAPKTAASRLAQAAVLVLLFAVLFGATRLMPHGSGRGSLVAATGFLLVAGTLLSELVEVVRLPHLSGYLLAGVLAGPHVFALIDHQTVTELSTINTLALALIAFEGGAELKLDVLRQGWKSLAVATLFQSLPVLLVMAGVFIAARPLVPFLRELTPAALVGAGLLWGAVAISRSPSATLGILSQTRAAGPLARYTLTFVMTSDVVVVVLVAVTQMVARPLIDPASSLSVRDLTILGHEIFGAVAMGTTLGLTLAAYLRLVGRQLSLVFVALGFGATEVLVYLRFDALLTFMVAGFVVQNLSRQGEKLSHAIGEMGSVVYVVFFAIAGANLDLPLLQKLWPVALLLASARGALSYVAARAASRVAGDPPAIKRWGTAGLISQAGLALGIAATVARTFPSFGEGFAALAIATVAINQMVGPVLFKLALDRTGESSTAPPPSLSSMVTEGVAEGGDRAVKPPP